MCELFHFFDRLYLYCIGVHETFGSVIPRTKVGEADAKREHPPGVLAGSIHGRAYGIQSVFFCYPADLNRGKKCGFKRFFKN